MHDAEVQCQRCRKVFLARPYIDRDMLPSLCSRCQAAQGIREVVVRCPCCRRFFTLEQPDPRHRSHISCLACGNLLNQRASHRRERDVVEDPGATHVYGLRARVFSRQYGRKIRFCQVWWSRTKQHYCGEVREFPQMFPEWLSNQYIWQDGVAIVSVETDSIGSLIDYLNSYVTLDQSTQRNLYRDTPSRLRNTADSQKIMGDIDTQSQMG